MKKTKNSPKIVIITGGLGFLGVQHAQAVLEGGNYPILIDVNMKNLSNIKKYFKKNFSHTINIEKCDITKINDVKHLKKKIISKYKKIDALINNVGVAGPTGNLEKLNSDDWEKTLKINVISHFYFSKLAIPMLKKNKGGSIINISSGAGIMGFPLRSPYAASKWAVIGMTKTLAMELGKYKIRVNAICPGTIKGDRMVRVIRDKSKFLNVSKKKVEKEFISMASMNCWIYEEDIGKTCSFLISNDGAKISGQTIPVDGNAIRLD